MRNLATTHRLDSIAKNYGHQCYEVPVGFKHISAQMAQSGAILGGKSSGGLTVTGHIPGKDGVFAASLLVEMVAVTGKKLSEQMNTIKEEYGNCHMEECAYSFSEQVKTTLSERLFVAKELPDLSVYGVVHESYMDGGKVYIANGGWVLTRF